MKHTISEIKISYRPKKLGEDIKITNSDNAYDVLKENWNKNSIEFLEEFKILLLNNSNEPLGIYILSQGGMTFTTVDLRHMFGVILKSAATAFITAHNHPSGKLKPSSPDINIHKKVKEIANFHEINYLDNLIITSNGKYSFQDEGIY